MKEILKESFRSIYSYFTQKIGHAQKMNPLQTSSLLLQRKSASTLRQVHTHTHTQKRLRKAFNFNQNIIKKKEYQEMRWTPTLLF